MVLARRPKADPKSGEAKRSLTEAEIQDLINRGGSASGEPSGNSGGGASQRLLRRPLEKKLRFYDASLIDRLERALEQEPVKVSANQWILQAINERLERVESDRMPSE